MITQELLINANDFDRLDRLVTLCEAIQHCYMAMIKRGELGVYDIERCGEAVSMLRNILDDIDEQCDRLAANFGKDEQ